MEYRNKKTGIVIDIQSKLSGENWELVTAKKEVKEVLQEEIHVEPALVSQAVSEQTNEPDSGEPTGNSDFDSITKKDIIQELDSMGIDYNPKAKKQELFDLMMGK